MSIFKKIKKTIEKDNNIINKTTNKKLVKDASYKIVHIEVKSVNEFEQIANRIKNQETVIVDFNKLPNVQAKEIKLFLGGVVYALEGNQKKINQNHYIFSINKINN